jgi:plastocyanin
MTLHVRRFAALVGAATLLFLSLASNGQTTRDSANPTTRGSVIQGAIKLPQAALVSEIVVYLSPGEGQFISPPTDVASISQKGAKFRPALLVICVGQTVNFLNDEDRPIEHNVFSNSPAMQFDLGLFEPGQKRSVTFDKPGAVLLYCSVHRHMDGVIYVAPSPYFCVASGDNDNLKYEIDGVPPGKWIVQSWQHRRRYRETEAEVRVTGDNTVQCNLQLGDK